MSVIYPISYHYVASSIWMFYVLHAYISNTVKATPVYSVFVEWARIGLNEDSGEGVAL